MELNEAIQHCRKVAAGYTEQDKCPECAADHAQLADWLEELAAFRANCPNAEQLAYVIWLINAEKDGRMVALPEGKATWIKAILAERDRQDRKWGFPQENTYCEWSSILAEEVGELARELNELNFGRGDQGRMELEAVQVAAVALAILEQSGVAQRVTVQAAVALGRVTIQVDERMGKEG